MRQQNLHEFWKMRATDEGARDADIEQVYDFDDRGTCARGRSNDMLREVNEICVDDARAVDGADDTARVRCGLRARGHDDELSDDSVFEEVGEEESGLGLEAEEASRSVQPLEGQTCKDQSSQDQSEDQSGKDQSCKDQSWKDQSWERSCDQSWKDQSRERPVVGKTSRLERPVERQVVGKTSHERPVVGKTSRLERPVLERPVGEERPVLGERQVLGKTSREERPVVERPVLAERPVVDERPVGERPVLEERQVVGDRLVDVPLMERERVVAPEGICCPQLVSLPHHPVCGLDMSFACFIDRLVECTDEEQVLQLCPVVLTLSMSLQEKAARLLNAQVELIVESRLEAIRGEKESLERDLLSVQTLISDESFELNSDVKSVRGVMSLIGYNAQAA